MSTHPINKYFKTSKNKTKTKRSIDDSCHDNDLVPEQPASSPPSKKIKCTFQQKGMLSPVKLSNPPPPLPLKALLSKAKKLQELRAVLDKTRAAKIEQVGVAEPGPEPAKVAPEDNIFNSPVKLKDIPTPTPAHKRFRHLLDRTPTLPTPTPTTPPPPPATLPLPPSSLTLLSLFTSTDTILSILASRGEALTFPRVRGGVAQLFKRVSLREAHVGQFLTVMPGCFSLVREGTELVFSPGPASGGGSGTRAEARKKEFKRRLGEIVGVEHEKFLTSLGIVVPPGTVITRHHPQFRLDLLPPIPAVPLPPPKNQSVASAGELIERAKGFFNRTSTATPTAGRAVPAPRTPSLSQLKGISASLLEKIRARAAASTLTSLTLPPSDQLKSSLSALLPSFTPVLRNIFVLERKKCLLREVVLERCGFSMGKSRGETAALLQLLSEERPNFVQIITTSGGEVWVKVELN